MNPLAQLLAGNLNPNAPKKKIAQTPPPSVSKRAPQTVNKSSLLHNLTHNPVTGFAGSIVKPTLQTGEALSQGIGNLELKLAGRPTLNNAQYLNQLPGKFNNYVNQGYTGTAKQITGNAAQTALLGVGGPLDNFATKSFVKAGAPKLLARAGSNAAIGAGFGAASTFGQGGNAKDIAKSAGINALLGGAIPIAGAGIKAAPRIPAHLQAGARALRNIQLKPLNEGGYIQNPLGGKEPTGNDLMKYFSELRKQHNDDNAFMNNVVYENVDKPGMIGQLAKSIARSDARDVGHGYSVTQMLDDQLSPLNDVYGENNYAQSKGYMLADLKLDARKLEKDTGQHGLFKNIAGAMKYMNADQQIEYLSNGLRAARDNGIMAAAHINNQNGFKPNTGQTSQEPLNEIGAIGKNVNKAKNDLLQNASKVKKLQGKSLFPEQRTILGREGLSLAGQPQLGKVKPPTLLQDRSLQGKSIPLPQSVPQLANNASMLPPDTPPRVLTAAPNGDINRLPKGSVGRPTKGLKQSSFASKTVPASEFVGKKVSKIAKENAPTYTPETERGRFANTLKSADQKGFDNFENDVQSRLEKQHIDSQTVADSIAVAQRLEAKADDTSLRRAADIYDKLSGHLTKNGQTVQAAAILARRNPEGIKFQTLKDITKAGGKITPEIQRNINTLVETLKKTKPGSVERKKALGQLAKEAEKHMPQNVLSNLVSVWKAGLLSGVKTTQGNIISNAMFGGLQKVSSPISVAADRGLSVFTGKRSVTATLRGTATGAKEGVRNGLYTLKTGVDLRDVKGDTGKYESQQGINFKNPVAQKVLGNPAQKIFDFMGAQDQPFYYSQFQNSLNDLAKVEGINKGLKGRELSDYTNNIAANPSQELAQRAEDEANKAVLGYDTAAYKLIQGAKNNINFIPNLSSTEKAATRAVVDAIAPFTRVPTAFISRTIDYTPLGIPKTVVSQVLRGKFDQRDLAKAIGEGSTGGSVIALGYGLAQNNLLSGNYPTDPKEQQRWKAQGIQPNSVKIGNKWVNLNYLGPVGLLFGAGKQLHDAAQDGQDKASQVLASIGGLGQSLLGQSFLSGFSGFTNAITDPKQNLKSFLNSQASSVVPAISNDFANLTDKFQRQADTPIESIKNKIPVLREQNKVKQDVYGNQLKQPAGQLNTLNGLKPSNDLAKNSPVLSEVQRLHNVDQTNKDLQVTPTPVDKSISVEGNKVKLDNQQRYNLQKAIGQATQRTWADLIKTPQYESLSDADKANALDSSRRDITTLTQRQFVLDNNLGVYDKAVTKKQEALSSGLNPDNYTPDSSNSNTSTTPKTKVKKIVNNTTKTEKEIKPPKTTLTQLRKEVKGTKKTTSRSSSKKSKVAKNSLKPLSASQYKSYTGRIAKLTGPRKFNSPKLQTRKVAKVKKPALKKASYA